MKTALIKTLVGVGDRIMVFVLPFAVVGLTANILWPSVFRMGSIRVVTARPLLRPTGAGRARSS